MFKEINRVKMQTEDIRLQKWIQKKKKKIQGYKYKNTFWSNYHIYIYIIFGGFNGHSIDLLSHLLIDLITFIWVFLVLHTVASL